MNHQPPPTPMQSVLPGEDRPWVLGVDDEPANLLVVSGALEPLGYRVVNAANARQALEITGLQTPHLVLLDVMMPGMTGIELCRRWRSDPALDRCPILLVTALGATSHRAAGLAAGADDYLEKPLDIDEVQQRVTSWMAYGRQPAPVDAGGSWTALARSIVGPTAPARDIRSLEQALARASGTPLPPEATNLPPDHLAIDDR